LIMMLPSFSSMTAASLLQTATLEPQEWATPIELEGAPNLHKISDLLYRGAQPTSEGMQALKNLGIKTIVNLRAFHSDRDEIGELALAYEHIPMIAVFPNDDDMIRFLHLVTDETRTPVFVHCQHGADRTGVMSAIYRIVVQGWRKQDAIDEMARGGFGFHSIYQNLIWFVEGLDVEKLKKNIYPEEQPQGE
jgi:protein tyrosine/serine phosphatase